MGPLALSPNPSIDARAKPSLARKGRGREQEFRRMIGTNPRLQVWRAGVGRRYPNPPEPGDRQKPALQFSNRGLLGGTGPGRELGFQKERTW